MNAGSNNLQSIGNQLANLEALRLETPESATKVMHSLQELSREVQVALDKIEPAAMTPEVVGQIQSLVKRIENLNGQLLSQSPLGLATAKIAEIMRKQP